MNRSRSYIGVIYGLKALKGLYRGFRGEIGVV